MEPSFGLERLEDSISFRAAKPGNNVSFGLIFMSWLSFAFTILLFAFATQEVGSLVWALWGGGILLAVLVLSMGWARRLTAQMLLGYFLLAGLLAAVPVGDYVAESFMEEFWRLKGGASYTLRASDPGASFLDATQLEFDTAFIDATKSIGFMKAGHLHCVAPVLSESKQRRASFWVVGVDCCGKRGEFACLGSQEAARSGIVLNDRDGIYTKAARAWPEMPYRRPDRFHSRDCGPQRPERAEIGGALGGMAQSVHGLEILDSTDILLLGWISDPQLYMQHLWSSATTCTATAILAFLLLMCCAAPITVRSIMTQDF
ncbi:unnamed protein product [Effrenium voratum]|nr:unnamed protein product [Effrenium voratum]